MIQHSSFIVSCLPFPLSVLFLRSVGTLSNLGWLRGLWTTDQGAAVSFRPARENEAAAAVRLVACSAGHVDERQVKEFGRLAEAHRLDLGGVWLAEQHGKAISAVLPIVSAGRTMLLFPAVPPGDPFHEEVLKRLLEAVCERAAGEGIHLAQVLLDDHKSRIYSLLLACGFARLAELLYMQASVPRNLREPSLKQNLRWVTYSPTTHELFARTILASYQQSLDCPALNGKRDINDIVSGHRATGAFDPQLWFVLCEADEPLAVLLLSRVPHADMIELVYLGIPPAQRGRGFGDLLMRHAAAIVSASRFSRLSLAVDAGNLPAMKLYWRHGLQAIGRKLALLRDLRNIAGAGVISPHSVHTSDNNCA